MKKPRQAEENNRQPWRCAGCGKAVTPGRRQKWRKSERVEGRWKFLDKSQEIRLGDRSKYHDFSF